MRREFFDNSAFVAYEALLRELHRLEAAGRGGTPAAEALRDEMEPLGEELSREEIARLGGLSADLYMLQGAEIRESLPESERTRERLGVALKEAWDGRDWSRALALLRQGPIFLTQAQVAYLRYRAYSELGHLETARLFLEYAAELDPENVTYRALVLDLRQRTRRLADAVEIAEAALADARTPVVLRLEAAGVLVRATEGKAEPEARRDYERAIEILAAALGEASQGGVSPGLHAAGYVWLGTCYQLLGRAEDARRTYNRALEIDPDNNGALMARGALRAEADPEGALEDFAHAVRVGTTLVIAYIYVMEASLARGDYASCLDLCTHVMRLTQKPELVAVALQATAIAEFHLGLPAASVRANLRAALDVDPVNESARRNLEELDRSLDASTGGQLPGISWQVPVTLERQEALRELRAHRPPVPSA